MVHRVDFLRELSEGFECEIENTRDGVRLHVRGSSLLAPVTIKNGAVITMKMERSTGSIAVAVLVR